MKSATKTVIYFGLLVLLGSAASSAAQDGRKVKSQVQPLLPEVARMMNLRGVVRLEVEIASNGTVKSTKPLGGHPLLIQSAEQAVRKWHFEPGPAGKTVIEFNFHQDGRGRE